MLLALRDWEKCSAHNKTGNLARGTSLLEKNVIGWEHTEFSV